MILNQRFWGIVNKNTGRLSRGISEYKIYSTRDSARKMNELWHKKKSGNYTVKRMIIETWN